MNGWGVSALNIGQLVYTVMLVKRLTIGLEQNYIRKAIKYARGLP